MFCRKCGKQIPDDSKFCYKCGAPVMTAPIHTETDKREPVNLEKEKPKPPTENTDKRVCARCGKEILSQSVRFCPHCGENLPQLNKGANRTVSQNVSLTAISSHKCDGCGELVYNNQRSCHNCGASNPSYNSRFDNSQINVQLSASSQSGTKPEKSEVEHKCRSCGKMLGNNRRVCPKCGTSNPYYDPEFEAKINDTVNRALTKAISEVQNDYSCSEEYESLKKGTLIALYVIMGIVVLVCMATGQFAFLGCTSPIEYEVGYTQNGAAVIIGWAIGLNIVRAIFLGCCKAAHKKK